MLSTMAAGALNYGYPLILLHLLPATGYSVFAAGCWRPGRPSRWLADRGSDRHRGRRRSRAADTAIALRVLVHGSWRRWNPLPLRSSALLAALVTVLLPLRAHPAAWLTVVTAPGAGCAYLLLRVRRPAATRATAAQPADAQAAAQPANAQAAAQPADAQAAAEPADARLVEEILRG